MKLSPRLQTIANYVKENSIVADIGTDHGYIPVYLIENGICKRIIASDVNEGPLNSAKDYIEMKGLTENIDLRLGDGLKVLNSGEVDTVIIAGMGGLLISNILEQSKEIVKSIDTFILQPMVAQSDLREYLYKNNFKIVEEKLCREGDKFYEIIVAKHGKDLLEDEIYLEVGKKLIENEDELLKEFLEKKLVKFEKIIDNMKKANNIEIKQKLEKTIEKYNKVMEVYRSL